MISVFSAIINVLKNGMYVREYKESTYNHNGRPFVELVWTASTVSMVSSQTSSPFNTNVSLRFSRFTGGGGCDKTGKTHLTIFYAGVPRPVPLQAPLLQQLERQVKCVLLSVLIDHGH